MVSRAWREAGDGEVQADPLADLMFTMIAVVLLALIVLLPFVGAPARPLPVADRAHRNRVVIGGKKAIVLFARVDGLRWGSATAQSVALEAIPNAPSLDRLLRRVRGAGSPLVVSIGPRGSEAAFELEPALARSGPKIVYQIRRVRQ